MADISKITLPNNTTYNIKDSTARTDITNIKNVLGTLTGANAVVFRGVSTTALTDGGDENPTVNESAVTSKRIGDVYFYGTHQFIYGADSKWHQLGSLDILGDFAYVSQGWVAVTPQGTISKPTITMGALSSPVAPRYLETQGSVGTTQANYASGHTSNGTVYYQPEGDVSTPAFTGTTVIFRGDNTPSGTVTLSKDTGGTTISINHTTPPTSQGQDPTAIPGYWKPTGTFPLRPVNIPDGSKTNVLNSAAKKTVVTNVGVSDVNATTPTGGLTYWGVSGQTLSFKWFTKATGDSIATSGTALTSVVSGDGQLQAQGGELDIKAQILSAPIKATFTGTSTLYSVSGTAQGTVSTPVFTGKKVVLTGHGTPTVSSVSGQTFTGQTQYWDVFPGVNEEGEVEPGGGLTG